VQTCCYTLKRQPSLIVKVFATQLYLIHIIMFSSPNSGREIRNWDWNFRPILRQIKQGKVSHLGDTRPSCKNEWTTQLHHVPYMFFQMIEHASRASPENRPNFESVFSVRCVDLQRFHLHTRGRSFYGFP